MLATTDGDCIPIMPRSALSLDPQTPSFCKKEFFIYLLTYPCVSLTFGLRLVLQATISLSMMLEEWFSTVWIL